MTTKRCGLLRRTKVLLAMTPIKLKNLAISKIIFFPITFFCGEC